MANWNAWPKRPRTADTSMHRATIEQRRGGQWVPLALYRDERRAKQSAALFAGVLRIRRVTT